MLQPGDHVEVFEGEQRSGVHGTVDFVAGDVVTVNPVSLDLEGQKMPAQVPVRSVRKRFKPEVGLTIDRD